MLTAAQQAMPIGNAQAGLWEISGLPGSKVPVRQCVSNLTALAEFEHRGKACTAKIIHKTATSVVLQYSCGAAGFGRSQVDVLTPRSLRIDTQGISNQLPFGYILQARRVDDCPARPSPPVH